MTFKVLCRLFVLAALLFMLGACGGGGGDPSSKTGLSTPIINVAYGLLPFAGTNSARGGSTTDTSFYFAFPIVTTNLFVANFVGVGLFYGQTPQVGATISIFSDSASQPNLPLVSSSMGKYLSGTTLADMQGTSYAIPNGVSEASFGNMAVSLTANTPYWVVVKFPSAVVAGTIWQSIDMPSTPSPRLTMKSADGITWTNITGYQGLVGTSNATVMPLVYLTD